VQYRHDVRFNVAECSSNAAEMIIYHRAHVSMFADLLRDDLQHNDICRSIPKQPTWQQKVWTRMWKLNHAPWMATAIMIIMIKTLQWYHRHRYRPSAYDDHRSLQSSRRA
jgi:hypothetical protein